MLEREENLRHNFVWKRLQTTLVNAMELAPEERAVLNVFRVYGTGRGEYLSVQTLERERMAHGRSIDDGWSRSLRSLVDKGCISRDPLGYGLTDKGLFLTQHLDDES